MIIGHALIYALCIYALVIAITIAGNI
jgi:hypothetical protein